MPWEDIVVNKHYFFPESCSQKRGIEGASDKKKGKKGHLIRRLASVGVVRMG